MPILDFTAFLPTSEKTVVEAIIPSDCWLQNEPVIV